MKKYILTSLLGVLVLTGWGCAKKSDTGGIPGETTSTSTPGTSSTSTVTVTSTPTTTPVIKPKATTTQKPAPKAPTYEEVLEKYREGGLLQFVQCRAVQMRFTIKKGTTFMIDNRDSKPHTIGIQGVSYKLGAYGYKILTANTLGTSYVTCDGGGTGEFVVQN